MNDFIEERTLTLAEYIIENKATVRAAVHCAKYITETGQTVRDAAKRFGLSKSTVHKDIRERLRAINPALFKSASLVLEENKKERHLRGGMATKAKYQRERKAQR